MNVGDKVKAKIGEGPALDGKVLAVKSQEARNEHPVVYLVEHTDGETPNRFYTPAQLTKVGS